MQNCFAFKDIIIVIAINAVVAAIVKNKFNFPVCPTMNREIIIALMVAKSEIKSKYPPKTVSVFVFLAIYPSSLSVIFDKIKNNIAI